MGNKILRYSVVVVSVLFIGYLSSLPSLNGYYDTTRYKTNTLTKNTQDLLKQLDEPVKITVYPNVINTFAHLGTPRFRIYDLKQFDEYTRFLPNLKIEYTPYYNYTLDTRDNAGKPLIDRAKRAATAYGYDFNSVLAPNEIEKIIDLKPELNGFVRVVEYKNKTANLRMFFDQIGYPKESEISAAVKNILMGESKIGVLTGNYERSIDKKGDKGYKRVLKDHNLRSSLMNQGFTVFNIPIDDYDTLPTDLSTLIIADPIEVYNDERLNKIKEYLKNGGNAMILGEPNKHHILNPILKEIGVQLTDGTLLQESDDYSLDLVQAKLNNDQAQKLGFLIKDEDKSVVSMPSVTAISYKDTLGFKVTPVLKTNESVWNHIGKINLETDSISFDKAKNVKIDAVVAIALSRDFNAATQKIMVIGDSDFMSNVEIKRFNLEHQENYQFVSDVFKWFSNNAYPIDTTRPEPIDNKILVNQKQIVWIKTIFIGLIPLILAVLGAYILINRKRN